MREKKLVIQIRCAPKDIIDFCLDPKNTPKWIDSIVTEQTNEWPPRIGTTYRNQDKSGVWSEYTLIVLQPTMFEMASTTSLYHVRYTFRPVTHSITEMEYFEWMEVGELEAPFTLDILQKLKLLLEAQ